MIRIVFCLLLSVAPLLVAAEKDTLRRVWASPAYEKKQFPEAWRPAIVPPTEGVVAAFKAYELKSLSIRAFVARYGMPDRYLVTQKKEGQDFLIYDLPSGHCVAIYVPKPPHESFSAIVIIDSAGDIVRLIK
jgi:hypothetical protein